MLLSSTRKFSIAFLFVMALSTAVIGQGCVIDTNNFELIYPPSEQLPCIERNVPYSATIQFFSLPSIGGFPVDSILITSFLQLPQGIHYALTPMPCKLYPYDRGCVYFSGTTTDTVGAYVVDYNGFAYTPQGAPSFDYLKAHFGGVLPEYTLKVIEPGAACPNTPSGINALDARAAFSIYPNPSNGIFEVATNAANASLNVSDASGRIIYSQSPAAPHSTINLSTYPKGLYLVQLRTETGIMERKVSFE